MTGCVVEEARPALVDPEELATYVHPSGAFTISLPPDWIVSDLSDGGTINVEFSPPGAADPLVGVYAISSRALNPTAITEGAGGSVSLDYDLDTLIATYLTLFYARQDASFHDDQRTLQPDGSMRLVFVIDGPEGITQHNDFVQLMGGAFTVVRAIIPADNTTQRTLDRVINSFVFNAGSEWAASIEQTGESGSAPQTVGFASLNTWTNASGGYEVMGQIVNNAAQALEFVQVQAVLFDTDGNALATQDDFVSSDLVLPGEYAPFSITFPNGLPPGTVRYELHADARYADFAARNVYGAENLALTSGASFNDAGFLVISGQVRNEGTQTAELVKVIVTVFDAGQRVIGTSTTLVDQEQLAPGDTSSYAVSFVELGGEPGTFQVTAQGIAGGG